MTGSERRIALDDGTSTMVESWGERGPVVLCVHGMTSSRRSWTRLAQHLQGRFRVVAYDQRGHGDSSGVTGPMSLSRGIRDAESVARELGEPIDALIGHSWGGAVAIEAGLRIPVRRVAAVDPMIRQVSMDWYDEYIVELGEQFASTGETRDARVREEFSDWHPLDVEGKVHAVHTMTVEPIARLLRENSYEMWDLRATIAGYDKPLLLAMAAKGESINDDASLEEIERKHSPDVRIETFPGAGHNLHRTEFESFVKILDTFLV